MLWVRLDKIAAYVPCLAEIESQEMVAMTRGVFELDAGV
jgi:hypothetical protein